MTSLVWGLTPQDLQIPRAGSSTLPPKTALGHQFAIRIYPPYQNRIGIYVKWLPCHSQAFVKVRFSLTIKDGSGRVVESKTTASQAKLSRISDSRGWANIVWEPLFATVQDGNAVIEVSILSLSPLCNQVGLDHPLVIPTTALSPLALYFNSRDFSDCAITIKGGPSFACHALVLAAASPVFRAMLSNGMAEADSKQIILHEVRTTTHTLVTSTHMSVTKLPFTCSC